MEEAKLCSNQIVLKGATQLPGGDILLFYRGKYYWQVDLEAGLKTVFQDISSLSNSISKYGVAIQGALTVDRGPYAGIPVLGMDIDDGFSKVGSDQRYMPVPDLLSYYLVLPMGTSNTRASVNHSVEDWHKRCTGRQRR